MTLRDGQEEIERLLDILLDRIEAMRDINRDEKLEGRFVEQMLITRFHELSEFANKTALVIAIDAVRKNEITKRNAADRLRIHPHTLDRAIKRFEEEYEIAKRHPLDPETLQRME